MRKFNLLKRILKRNYVHASIQFIIKFREILIVDDDIFNHEAISMIL
jgi:hypothetical protein